MTPPINIDGTQITGASIDGQDVSAITVDGTTVFSDIPASAVFQLDANELLASDGDNISDWQDQLGSNSVSQSTTSEQPNFSTTGNITPAVVGDGSDDELTDTDPSNLPSGTAEFTIIVVMESKSAATDDELVTYGNINGNNGEVLRIVNSNRNTTSGDLQVDCVGGNYVVNGFFGADEKHLLTIQVPPNADISDSGFNVRDKGSVLSPDENASQSINIDMQLLTLFSKQGTNHSGDAIGEILVFDKRLSGTELNNEESRLASKHGITL